MGRDQPVRFSVTEPVAIRLASFAVRINDWEVLDEIEDALKASGFDGPTVLDVYAENDVLRKRLRALGEPELREC